MNKKNIIIFQIFSTIFVAILGTLLHFTFEWSNENYLIAIFSAVNESTWEHLKLLFFPMLLTTIIGYFYFGKSTPTFLCAKTTGILGAIFFTVIFFYTSGGIIGSNIAIFNIATFYIAIILGEYIGYKIMLSKFSCNQIIAFVILFVLLICFIIFTYFTPQIGLFKDPITNTFGI